MTIMDQNTSKGEDGIIKVAPVELGIGSKHILKDLVVSMLPEGGYLNFCYNCGACSSGCPASGVFGMDPRKFVRMISLGMDEEIMTNDWVWICTRCNRCFHVCPMKVDIPKLVFIIRSQWPEEKRPENLVGSCQRSLNTDTGSTEGISVEDWKFIVEDVVDDVRQTQQGFEDLKVPMDEKGARLFLTQNSSMPLTEPQEMAPLWKILHIANADWTYGSKGWAAENSGYLLANDEAWEKILRKKTDAVEQLGCEVLVNTECGHDFFAVNQGLERFKIPHAFEVKSIIEYYADWIRKGRLKVTPDWNQDLKIKFTVQDPCQLVRKSHGDFLAEELRFVVKEAVGEENFIDMYPNRSNNYCCGGGGGVILSGFEEERLSYGELKLQQILETEAAYCITPCTNCHNQILDLSRFYRARFRAVHLWTILCLSMGILGESERKYLGDDLAMVGLK